MTSTSAKTIPHVVQRNVNDWPVFITQYHSFQAGKRLPTLHHNRFPVC